MRVDLHPEEAVGAERPGHVGEGQAGDYMFLQFCAMCLVWHQMCQVRADASEKERDFRSKQQSLQKAHGEQMEQLKVGGSECDIV